MTEETQEISEEEIMEASVEDSDDDVKAEHEEGIAPVLYEGVL